MSLMPPSSLDWTNLDLSSLTIRRMRDSDVAGVMAIESVSFGRHHWSEDSFYNEMKNNLGRYYVLEGPKSGQILGYCGFWLVFDEVHITTVAVMPECRGKSLGEVMLLHILDKVMGQSAHWVTLEVRVTNTPAINLYYKYGFQNSGLRPRYYQDNGEDALIMTTTDILTEDYRSLFTANKAALKDRLGALPQGVGAA
jgi:ribosomal-protein-alanine N-acetyltransferase